MSSVSRRDFLRALGIGVAASAAPWSIARAAGFGGTVSAGQPALWGRAFAEAPVTDAFGHVVRMLRPDEVTPLRPLQGSLVQLPDGRTDRRNLQPIARAAAGWSLLAEAGWAQVAASFAVLRRWCSTDAPLVARPGWGAVLYAETLLRIAGTDWLGLQLGNEVVWSPVAAWRVAPEPEPEQGTAILQLERRARRMTAIADGRALWTAEAAIPAGLSCGHYPLVQRTPADSTREAGAPWALDFGAWRMTGAYWHNSFADAGYQPPRERVELPVLAAQAAYALPVSAAHLIE